MMSLAGPNCQTNINECASNPCLNQGTCIDDVAGYKCNCLLPYTGIEHALILPLSFFFILTHTNKNNCTGIVQTASHGIVWSFCVCGVCVSLNTLCAFYQTWNFWYISCISTSYFPLRGKLRMAGNCCPLYCAPGKCQGNNSAV